MMDVWQEAGYTETALRDFCALSNPDGSQNNLQLLLSQELINVDEVHEEINVCDVITETARYFLPTE